jgi:signal transduction histidine kinase
VGTFEVDPSSRSFCYSENLAKILGLPAPAGPLPIDALAEHLEPANPSGVRAHINDVCDTGASSIQVGERRPFGDARHRRTLFLPVRSGDEPADHVLGIAQDISALRIAEDEVRRLSHRLLSAQVDEQRRLSRNLHETVSQTLAAIKLSLGKIGRSLPAEAAVTARRVDTTRDLTEDAIREVRSVAILLHPPSLDDAGLCAALRVYTRAFSERSGIRVSLSCSAAKVRMPREIELALFRIVQESLTNVQRHAKAQRASILVKQPDHRVTLEIRDDGVGISQRPGSRVLVIPYGVGIAGMQEHALQLNGTFRMHSIPGRGTVVSVSLPIALKPEASATRS